MPQITQDPVRRVAFTVASGGTDSDDHDLLGHVVVGVVTPAALTSTTVSFDVYDQDLAAWLPLYDSDGNEVSITVAASRHTVVSPLTVPYAARTRIRTGSAEAADRVIRLVTRALG